jgi:FlaA1/EpsC-like NDP-sugar epimerase
VVKDMLNDMGLGCKECSTTEEAKLAMAEWGMGKTGTGYPCEFFGSDTSGEKTFEEFYTESDEKDETKFINLGVVKNSKKRTIDEVEGIFARLHEVFDREESTKADVVEVLSEYLPDFRHIEKGKGLDSRM